MMEKEIHELLEATGVFIEAAVADTFNNLVFASLWGHTAAIQNTIAKIVTGDLQAITIAGQRVAVSKEMVKKVGKLPKDNPYGDMTHALIYRPTTQAEQAGRREILFYGQPPEALIANVVKSMSVLPLMDTWLDTLLAKLREKEMLIDLKTLCGDVHGIHVSLGNEEEFETMLSELIKTKQLTIVGDAS